MTKHKGGLSVVDNKYYLNNIMEIVIPKSKIKFLQNFSRRFDLKKPLLVVLPGDFRSWESPQTLRALFIGLFEHVERFRNLKFAVIRITDIHSTVLSSSEGTAAIHLAFKITFNKQ